MTDFGFQFDHSYTQLPDLFYTRQKPTPVSDPRLTVINHSLAGEIGLDFSGFSEQCLAELFSGNQLPDNALPISQAYAGHQFGSFTMLGDGRAIILGEQRTPQGGRVDIQFKGSGRTPYSRGGDGRAALKPMLREYIISEAMHALHIPTTRSLAVAVTGDTIMRESPQTGAVLTRVADSHIRVGTFEFAAANGTIHHLESLLDYTARRHYPSILQSKDKALQLLRAVAKRQAFLLAEWLRVGFIHGVMNTDNMAVSGETIDYGPCAFMDHYDPETVFSSIDHDGRYAFNNQPFIAQWNLARLGETLLPLIADRREEAIERVNEELSSFRQLLKTCRLDMMRHKLGMEGSQPGDKELIDDCLCWMKQYRLDYTNTFRALMMNQWEDDVAHRSQRFDHWHRAWQERLKKNRDQDRALTLMQRSNPAVIPRNHKVEQALHAADHGDLTPLWNLLAVLLEPYKERPELAIYQTLPKPHERVYQTFCGT